MSWAQLVITGGSIVVALIGAWALLITSRQSRRATAESVAATSEAQLEAARIKDREALVTQQGEALDRLWKRVEQLEVAAQAAQERAAAHGERIVHLERENADLRQHTVECADNVADLRQRIEDYAHRYREAVQYVRRLHDWMAEHLPIGLKPPDPPEGLAFDLADPMQAPTPPDGWPPRGEGPARRLGT